MNSVEKNVNWKALRQERKIVIPEGVESIPPKSFQGSKIETILIPSSVKEIGESAFKSCESLSEVRFAEGSELKTIGDNAFSGCNYVFLNKIELPVSLEKIGEEAFAHTAIKEVHIRANLKYWGIRAFVGCEYLKKVIFDEGVEIIPNQAFMQCKSLDQVELPISLRGIGESAFLGTNIKELYIHGSLKLWNEWTFAGCNNLKKVIVEEGIETIPPGTFMDCICLDEISLPSTLKKIGSKAFDYCLCLPEIHMPAALEEIGGDAFYNCTSLRNVFELNLTKLKVLSASVFKRCSSLEKILLPATLEEIDSAAFLNCEQLENVIGLNSTKVKSIAESAFEGCIMLVDIELPPCVQVIKDKAFKGCGIVGISLSENLKSIGNEAFCDCVNLANISIPESVEFLGDKFLAGCNELKELKFPYSATTHVGIDWVPENLKRIIFDDIEILGGEGSLALIERDFKGTRLESYFQSIAQVFLTCGKQKAIESMVSYAGMAG